MMTKAGIANRFNLKGGTLYTVPNVRPRAYSFVMAAPKFRALIVMPATARPTTKNQAKAGDNSPAQDLMKWPIHLKMYKNAANANRRVSAVSRLSLNSCICPNLPFQCFPKVWNWLAICMLHLPAYFAAYCRNLTHELLLAVPNCILARTCRTCCYWKEGLVDCIYIYVIDLVDPYDEAVATKQCQHPKHGSGKQGPINWLHNLRHESALRRSCCLGSACMMSTLSSMMAVSSPKIPATEWK